MNTETTIKLSSILKTVAAQPLTDEAEGVVTGCYISDLLSDVLAHARAGVLWVTIQTHRNVVSVAAMKEVSAVLITCGRRPDAATVAEATDEGVILLSTPLTTYEVAGKLWEAELR